MPITISLASNAPDTATEDDARRDFETVHPVITATLPSLIEAMRAGNLSALIEAATFEPTGSVIPKWLAFLRTTPGAPHIILVRQRNDEGQPNAFFDLTCTHGTASVQWPAADAAAAAHITLDDLTALQAAIEAICQEHHEIREKRLNKA
jgi:hypothetical protein